MTRGGPGRYDLRLSPITDRRIVTRYGENGPDAAWDYVWTHRDEIVVGTRPAGLTRWKPCYIPGYVFEEENAP